MPPDARLLVTADLHLGRHPTRVPEELDGPQFSPAALWDATVETAVERDVDAVLLAGDAVDDANHSVEAFGDLERGARRLEDAGIELVAVAGNHDHDALPEVVDSLDADSATLLGADGTWERHSIRRDGEVLCHVDGWSFPSGHVLRSPLDDYDPAAIDDYDSGTSDDRDSGALDDHDPHSFDHYDSGTSDDHEAAANDAPDDAIGAGATGPVVGLLHADLDARDSDYAPVERVALETAGADAWVLGHVHAPAVRVDRDPTVLYPGSPQPLDPGEPGTHGPWLLTVEQSSGSAGARVEADQLPLATVRYDDVAVDVADAAGTVDVPPAVRDAVEAHVDESVPVEHLELLLAQVRLTGRTEAHGEFVAERSTLAEQLALQPRDVDLAVESLAVDTGPDVDLEALAGDETPVGYLAELLLALEADTSGTDDGGVRGDRADDEGTDGDGTDGESTDDRGTADGSGLEAEHEELVDGALDRLRETAQAPTYARLRREERIDQRDRADAVEALADRARLLLDALLEQREERA